MSSVEDVTRYYAARAPEYLDSVAYAHGKFAAVMAPVKARYQLALQGRDVLEIACGPGYWTEAVAVSARSILATDVNPNLVEIVRTRLAGLANVRSQVADAYSLEGVSGSYNAALEAARLIRSTFSGRCRQTLLPP